jgi:ArsR family transcriptional regulator
VASVETDKTGCAVIHKALTVEVKRRMPGNETLEELARFFKVLSDATRVKILCALLRSEMCVCDLAHVLGMSQSSVSHQLRLLKDNRVARSRREGKIIYYSLDDEHIRKIFDDGFEHVSEGQKR